MEATDLLIIGAGPAGMAAAVAARAAGLSVIVADENAEPGGQIYRRVLANAQRPELSRLLGADYLAGLALAQSFMASGADFRPRTTVFEIAPDGSATLLGPEAGGYVVRAQAVMIATGAYERPLPIPGWTLPGVMTAGAAQTLLKTSAQVPSGPVVLAGGGPLLWYVAKQLRGAGAEVAAVLSFTPLASYLRQAGAALGAWRNAADLAKGAGWMAGMHLGATSVRHGVELTRISGSAPELELHYRSGGADHSVKAATVLLHADLIPNVQASRSLGLDHDWDPRRGCWQPRVDAWGVSSIPAILVAGDGAGIRGARDAVRGGTLVALGLAERLGRISVEQRDLRAAPLLAERARELRLRAYFDRLFEAPRWVRVPADDSTLVCRCEVVTAGEVRAATRLGAHGPNQVKAYVRAGMGACQGRMCAQTVAAVIADELGVPAAEVPTQRVRPPLKPVHLGDLAALDLGDDDWAGRSVNEALLHAPFVEPSAAEKAHLH